MFKLIDRLLLLSYVKSYSICLVSLLGLYIIVDLFNNIDEFTRIEEGLVPTLKHIGTYYMCRTTLIFDRLSEAIVLLAAMFTVAWIQRSNELLPLLSAGVSTGRVIRPVLIGACAFVGLNVANQELLIPRVGAFMVMRGDPNQERDMLVSAAFDANRVQLSGKNAILKDRAIYHFTCVIPAAVAHGHIEALQAEKAVYVKKSDDPLSGGWLLTKTKKKELQNWRRDDVLKPLAPGKYFLYTDIDFDRLTRKTSFYEAKSMWELWKDLHNADPNLLARIAVIFHMRLTRPLLGLILVVMGLGVILRDQNRHVFISIGFCLLLCALFFLAIVAARYLGDQEILSPAMAAWLPVFVFGPVAFVLFDAVHT